MGTAVTQRIRRRLLRTACRCTVRNTVGRAVGMTLRDTERSRSTAGGVIRKRAGGQAARKCGRRLRKLRDGERLRVKRFIQQYDTGCTQDGTGAKGEKMSCSSKSFPCKKASNWQCGMPHCGCCLITGLRVNACTLQHDMPKPAGTKLFGGMAACQQDIESDTQRKNIRSVICLHNAKLFRSRKACGSEHTSVFVDMGFI